MTSIENLQKKEQRNNIILFFLFAIVYLFIYGAMITNMGYNGDTLDHIGSERLDTYRASGRWFHALWRWAIGTNPHTIAQSLTSCLFFSLSLVILANVLQIKENSHKLLFGLIYLILPQYAYVMNFIYQADTVAFGLTCVALASYFITKQGARNYLYSLIFLVISLAIYQSLILNFCAIIMTLIYNRIEKELDGKAILLKKSILCALCSLITYFFISKLVIFLVYTKPFYVNMLEAYRASFNNTSKLIYSGDLHELFRAIYWTFKALLKTLIHPHTYTGEWIYLTSYIPLIYLLYNILKKQFSSIKKIILFCILIGIWIMPFFLIIAFLNPGAMAPHNRLCEPLSLACLWLLGIQVIQWNKIKELLFLISITLLGIKSANYVNEHANIRRFDFEAQFTAYRAMEFEAAKKASEANIPIKRENILLFNIARGKQGFYDPFRKYPALTFIKQTSSIQNEKYAEVLDKMGCFPEKNSIIIYDGKIIIKCDSSCLPKASLINH